MTDSTSDIAGDYPGGIRITCILDEGAPTITDSYDSMGRVATGYAFATPLVEGDVVAISNDEACMYEECGGIPCVEKAVTTEVLTIGRIVSTPKLQTMAANDAAADTLVERLAGDFYRTAVVELWGGITKVVAANIMKDGSVSVVVGQSALVKFNIARCQALHTLCFDAASSAGTGVVVMHFCGGAGTNGDTITALVGINGVMTAITGA